ncbi:YcxB family protein [Promicromonospora iranensis]|uniref:YcxB family protein n=1 Tax=Promicromonospora iranensis TaxID=1105144 RepID=UPI0023A96685|nr:YcxB family protein [Promicromonospora iranensis]
MNTENSISTRAISAQWNPEPRDMKALVRSAGVPRGLMLLFVVVWVLGMLLAIGWRYEPIGRAISTLLLLAPLTFLVCLFLAQISLPRWTWKTQRGGRRPTSCRVAPDGITVEQDVVTSRYTWGAVDLAIESTTAFVLYVSPAVLSTPVLVPKRALRPEDIAPMRDLITTHASRFRKR